MTNLKLILWRIKMKKHTVSIIGLVATFFVLVNATFAEQKEKGFEIKELMTGGNPFAPGE